MPDLRSIELHTLIAGSPDPALVLDGDLTVTMVNEAMAAQLGRTVAELLGRRLAEGSSTETARRRERTFAKVIESGRAVSFEERHGDRHFACTIIPVRDASGQVVAAAGVTIDTTPGKIVDDRLRRMVTTCLEGIWEIDAESRTTFANEQMARMIGYAADDMIGRSMYEFMDADARALAMRNVSRRQQGIAERHEFRLQHKDGSPVFVIMAASPLRDEDGRYAGAVAMVTDVTELRSLEQRLLDAQKLESLALLAGGIAHDFNNLLVGILGNASLAARTLPPDAEAREYLDEIIVAGARAADLTSQMLAYAGRRQVSMEPLDLGALVAEMAQLVRTTIPKDATIEVVTPTDDLVVVGDATQLRQVVMNLIVNAGEAIEGGPGSVTVTTTVETLDEAALAEIRSGDAAPGRFARLDVRDTGCGMDRHTQERLFDPFFTTKQTGRGLGLAAVLGIIRAHGGALAVETAPGAGTTISVFLPLAAVDAAPPRARDSADRFHGDGVALIVDDQPEVRGVLARCMEHFGFATVACGSGEAALHAVAAAETPFRVALLDVTMPGADGTEILRRLRDAGHDLPVILVSGRPRPPVDEARAGRYAFLPKPFDLTALARALRAVLEPAAAPSPLAD